MSSKIERIDLAKEFKTGTPLDKLTKEERIEVSGGFYSAHLLRRLRKIHLFQGFFAFVLFLTFLYVQHNYPENNMSMVFLFLQIMYLGGIISG